MPIRPRRLRRTPGLRALVRETTLTASQLIAPIFIHGGSVREPVAAMPGVSRLPVADLAEVAREFRSLGIRAVILFGVPAHRDALGSESFSTGGVVQRAVRALKAADPDLVVITDVCLCEYTDHGHCGVPAGDGSPDNDATLPILGRIACSHAEAGADVVAPSGMMDGAVAAIRQALDAAGHEQTAILSYSVKFASALYGPFREAAGSAPVAGDRRAHQMDVANAREALREADLDVREGADMLMVKPAGSFLDVLHQLRTRHPEIPLVAYQVSGEYAMLRAAGAAGWLDERAATLESLLCIRRAGADAIITYAAADVARWLRDEPWAHT